VLAGVAATLVAVQGAPGAARAAALLPPDLPSRTTPLSATLLALAAQGDVMEPVRALLDPRRAGPAAWLGALRRLERTGHSTGPAYAAAVGATLVWLGTVRPSRADGASSGRGSGRSRDPW
jgi:hypothetical protein